MSINLKCPHCKEADSYSVTEVYGEPQIIFRTFTSDDTQNDTLAVWCKHCSQQFKISKNDADRRFLRTLK